MEQDTPFLYVEDKGNYELNEVANSFDEFFVNVGPDLADEIFDTATPEGWKLY